MEAQELAMEVDKNIPIEEEGRGGRTCLKHSKKWRSKFQHLLNMLREEPFNKHIIDRIGKVVCTCDSVQGSKNLLILENDRMEAIKHFKSFIEKRDKCSDVYSHLLFHFKQMRKCNLLGDGDTSAKRFLYLFYRIDKFKDIALLQPLNAVKNQGPPKFEFELPLTKLKEEYIGLFIGRRGRKLKTLLKPYRNSKVTLKKEGDNLKAMVSCREEDKNEIITKLTETEDSIICSREAHEARVKEHREQQMVTEEDPPSGSG